MFAPRRASAFLRGQTNHVTGANLFNRAAPALRASAAGGDDQRLSQRMRVPCRARAGFKGDIGAGDTRRIGYVQERVHAHRAGEVIRRALYEGCEPFRLISIDSCPLLKACDGSERDRVAGELARNVNLLAGKRLNRFNIAIEGVNLVV